MKILITNDDGISAPGIAALVKEIKKIGEVVVVAPSVERSAVGHAITLSDPLRVWPFYKNGDYFGSAVNGTPADCVKLAYWALLKDKPKPDLLISGINLGSNTGINTIYSGTVSAATEGAIVGLPAFAISLTTFKEPDFSYAARFAKQMALHLMQKKLPKGVYLNVNVPAVPESEVAGVAITSQGKAVYEEEFDRRCDPHGREYYWLTGKKMNIETNPEIDDRAILDNKVSITPVHYDLTHYEFINELKSWNIGK